MKAALTCALAGGLLATAAQAGGFAVADQDAQASGRAGTAIAREGNAAAIHYNPAGLTGLQGMSATAGVSALVPSVAADTGGATVERSELGVKIPPHVYAAYGAKTWSAGLGFNAPFGGGVKWDDGWSGRYDLVEQKLEVLAGHAAGAYRITDALSVGATLSMYRVSVAVDKRLDFVDQEGSVLLAGGGTGIGAGVGAQWAPMEALRFGLQLRLPTTVALSGDARFSNVPASMRAQAQDQRIQTSLTLPAKVGLGAQFDLDVGRPMTFFAEGEWTAWSSFENFAVDFERQETSDVNQPRNWNNTLTGRLGAETKFGETFARLGVFLDGAASPADTLSPSLPDSTRWGATVGGGREFGRVRADAAYMFVAFVPRASEGNVFRANYSANAHMLALTLAYNPVAPPQTPELPAPEPQ